jgi:hypothetical protein
VLLALLLLLLLLLLVCNKNPFKQHTVLPATSLTPIDVIHTFVTYEQSPLGIHSHALP